MFRNVGSKELCLSLSVISLASLIVHPVEACSRPPLNTWFSEFETVEDVSDTTPPASPTIYLGNRQVSSGSDGCLSSVASCEPLAFFDLILAPPEEDVGYVITASDPVFDRGFRDAPWMQPEIVARTPREAEDGVLRIEWDKESSIDVTLSISAVDRAGNLSEPVEVRLAF